MSSSAVFEASNYNVLRMHIVFPCKLEEEEGKLENEASLPSRLAVAEGKVDRMTSLLGSIASTVTTVPKKLKEKSEDVLRKVKDAFVDFKFNETYLYLIDEIGCISFGIGV